MTDELRERIERLDAILSDPDCAKKHKWDKVLCMDEELQMLKTSAGLVPSGPEEPVDLTSAAREGRKLYKPAEFDAQGRIVNVQD